MKSDDKNDGKEEKSCRSVATFLDDDDDDKSKRKEAEFEIFSSERIKRFALDMI